MGGFLEVGDDGEDPAVPEVVRRTIAAARAAREREFDAQLALPEEERERFYDLEFATRRDGPIPDAIARCLALCEYTRDLYDALRAPEMGKIWLALDRLDALVWGNPDDDES
jgi:hypothetical protein